MTFWDALNKSVLISGIIAVGCWGTIIYLSVIQTPIPQILETGGIAILAFYFGAKVQQAGSERAG